MTQQVQSNKEANLSKQVAELQGRVKSLEQLLHQGKDVLTLEEAAKFMGIARVSLPNRLEYVRIRGQAGTGSRAGCPLGKDRAKAILNA